MDNHIEKIKRITGLASGIFLMISTMSLIVANIWEIRLIFYASVMCLVLTLICFFLALLINKIYPS